MNDLTLLQGRMFTDDEDQRAEHVVVLGHDTWEELFGDQNAIGKEVSIETGLYTVIGVLDKRKQPFGGGKNQARQHGLFPHGDVSQPASRRQGPVGQREVRRSKKQVAGRGRDSRDAAHSSQREGGQSPTTSKYLGRIRFRSFGGN